MPQAIPAAIAAFTDFVAIHATSAAVALGMSGANALAVGSFVGNFVSGALTLGMVGSGVGGALGGLAATAGVSALLQPDVPTVGAQIQTKAGSVIPRTMVMGRTAIGGVLANDTFYSGKDDGVATQFYILSGAGDCGTVEKILVGDDEVTFNAPVNGIYRAVGKYSGALWMCQKSGGWTQTAIDFNGGGNGLEAGAQPSEWTTNHRLLGCMTTSLMVGRYNEPIKSNGLNGSIVWVVKAENVGLTDPRTGAAATTWAQKQNPWVWAYSYLKTISSSVSPTGIKLAGCDISDAGIDTASFAYAANVADTNGFTIAGEVVLESGKKNETLQGMCQAGGGSYTFRNGKVYATVASVKAVAGYLTNEHIRDDITVAPLAAAQVTPNRIVPKFISEANSWKVIEGSVVTDSAFVTEDGTERTTTYEIPYCGGGATQAGKIAALALVNAREPHQFDIPLQPSGRYLALAGDCLQITADLTDWVGQKILVDKITGNGDLTSSIHAVSETDSKYAWGLGQTTDPPDYTASLRVDKTYVATPTGTAWAVTGTQITQGSNIVPCIRVTGSASEYAGCGGVVVEYKPAAGSTWYSAGDLVYTSSGVEITSVTPNTEYNVRIAYYNQYGVRGTYYQPAAVTTGNLQAGTSADGAAALSAVGSITDPNILGKEEKPDYIKLWNTVQTEYTTSNWVSTASGLGITTEVTAYQNAYIALSNHLASLTIAGGASTNWYDTAVNTAINRTNWNNAWQGYDTTKLALQAKINAVQIANVGLGTNSLINGDFSRGLIGYSFGNISSPWRYAVDTIAPSYTGARHVLQINYQGTTLATGTYVDVFISLGRGLWDGSASNATKYALKVKLGDRVYFRGEFAKHRLNRIEYYAMVMNSSGIFIQTKSYSGGTEGGGGGGLDMQTLGGIFDITAADAAYMQIMVRAWGSGESDPYVFVGDLAYGKVAAGQTALPAFSVATDPTADETLTAQITPSGFTSTIIDFLGGVPASGQLPRAIQARAFKGGTEVTSAGTWAISNAQNCTVSVSNAAGSNGVETISALAGTGNVERSYVRTFTYNGVAAFQQKVTIGYNNTDSAAVQSKAGALLSFGNTISSSSWVPVATSGILTITNTPASALVNISGGIGFTSPSGDCTVNVRLKIDGVVVYTGLPQVACTGGFLEATDFSDVYAYQNTALLSAGTHTFSIEAQRVSGTGSVVAIGNLNVVLTGT